MQENLKNSVAEQSGRGNTPDSELPPTNALASNEIVNGDDLVSVQQDKMLKQWTWQIVQDLRNYLQVISGHGEMLCATMGEDELRWHRDEIQKAVSQAAEASARLQVLAENGLRMFTEVDPGPEKPGGLEPQATSSTELPGCANTCRLLGGADLTVFWRKVPSLRGPFSVDFLAQCAPGGLSELQGMIR